MQRHGRFAMQPCFKRCGIDTVFQMEEKARFEQFNQDEPKRVRLKKTNDASGADWTALMRIALL